MKHVSLAVIALFLAATPAVAQGQRMTVATFLAKVADLKRKGVMALLSPDVKLIKAEMKIVAAELQADKKAREAAGKPPLACPPQGGGKKMGGDEFLKALEAIPPAQRGMSLKDGFVWVAATKYPCR